METNAKQSDHEKKARSGIYAAVAAAAAASVCCLGPLVLVGLGASGAWIGSLSAMEPLRPFFVGLTVTALAYAFWRVYGPAARPQECGPEGACKVEKAPIYNKIALWTATVGIGAMLAAPGVLGAAAGRNDGPAARPIAHRAAPVAPATVAKVTLAVENMTCAGCAATVRQALTRVPGVLGAKVTSKPPCAQVDLAGDRVSPRMLLDATAAVGYPSRVAGTSHDDPIAAVCAARGANEG